MNWLLSIPALFQNLGPVISLLPLVEKYFSGSLSLDDLIKAAGDLPAAAIKALEFIGAQKFPALAPQFHVVAVLTMTFHKDRIMWFQDAYNHLLQPPIPLVVDGLPGPKTDAAILTLQAKFGLAADGWLGQQTLKFVQGLLEQKKSPAVTPTTMAW